ncbi:MAG: PAS domain-containing protein [Oceanicoccus sp.]
MNEQYQQVDRILLNQAVDASSCGISIADASKPDMPLVYVNQCFETMTGYSWQEIEGKNCRFLQGGEQQPKILTTIKQTIKSLGSCTVVVKNYRKTGGLFYNELHLSPLLNRQGEVSHYVGIQTDVTERETLNKQMQQHQSQLELLIAERTVEIEHKNIALQELVSQVELDRRALKENITANVDAVIMPLVKKLRRKSVPGDAVYLDMLVKHLIDLTSPYGNKISRRLFALSPKEIEVCTFITNGMSSKEIASFFNVSQSTIENQRNTIRKKLGIAGKPINLTSYLLSL